MFRPVYLYFLFSSLLVFGVIFTLLVLKLKINLLTSYFIAVNATVFFLYAYDKTTALFSFLRIPEGVLHLFSFVGASPMAYIAQKFFSHKTKKLSFQSTFKRIVLSQVFFVLALGGFLLNEF